MADDGRRSAGLIVTGTDTGVGKTVFAAALTAALDGAYWKPIQAGTDGETDPEVVLRLSGVDASRILPSAYTLRLPASPHIAARRQGVDIRGRRLGLPRADRTLVVEGAGGVMVPISARLVQADLFAGWGLPVILCARTALGTINHSLLSLEALRRRRVPVLGVAFIGPPEPEVEATIAELGSVRRLGRLPLIEPLDRAGLASAFAAGFDVNDLVE